MTSGGRGGSEILRLPHLGNTNNYNISSDLLHFQLQLTGVARPVANFSGTPTLGAAAAGGDLHRQLPPTPRPRGPGPSATPTLRPCRTRATTYSGAGSYTVALTATNACGNNTNTKNNYITVGNAPVANFSGTPTIRRAAAGGDLHGQLHL